MDELDMRRVHGVDRAPHVSLAPNVLTSGSRRARIAPLTGGQYQRLSYMMKKNRINGRENENLN